MASKLGKTAWHISVHAPFDDRDLDARSSWVGKGKYSVLNYFDNYKEATSIQLATTVGHLLRDFDFENDYMS